MLTSACELHTEILKGVVLVPKLFRRFAVKKTCSVFSLGVGVAERRVMIVEIKLPDKIDRHPCPVVAEIIVLGFKFQLPGSS